MPPTKRSGGIEQLFLQTSKFITLAIVPNSIVQPGGTGQPTISGPTTTGDPNIVTWIIDQSSDEGLTSATKDSFVTACGGGDHILAPYTSTRPSQMYFFFAVHVTVNAPGIMPGSSTIYIGQGWDGARNPWRAGGADITVEGNTIGTLIVKTPTPCSNAQAIAFKSQNRNDVHEIDFLLNHYVTS